MDAHGEYPQVGRDWTVRLVGRDGKPSLAHRFPELRGKTAPDTMTVQGFARTIRCRLVFVDRENKVLTYLIVNHPRYG